MDNTEHLWADFNRTRSFEARDALVMKYLSLVKSIVRRIVPTYRQHTDFDDIVSYGLIGLIDAIDRFDAEKGAKFVTYASLRIRGEIIDQIRKQDWAPYSLRQKIKKVEEAFDTLENELGHSATESEVADYLSMHPDDVKRVLDESNTFNIVSLDELLIDSINSYELINGREQSPEKHYEHKEMKGIIAGCLDRLSEKERMVISLYYYEELTLKELGVILGVSESRACQLHSKAIMSLKNKIKRALPYG